ncbi:helix-turn-helix domain-containing protein [Streptomyces endophyticus]|uniref:Helix-turn-helix domain-containing protein n=1 Tax=Streptomyces endophyticus TaxID=714166 RepID=A0ABU6F359_9ACTN|nr:helix-turn-helix domain-containing protein [Streptomyces endophyticus]MEB8338438.1 helix-turn-helix domain-containing protein [Streptomyces endophyticus]
MNGSGTAGMASFGGAWTVFPQRLGDELRKENRTLAAEIIHEIRRQIPEFSRPLSGKFGAFIRNGVETALAEFVDRVGEGGGELDARRLPVYRALGRSELAEGRSLDALQAAYRLGGRVAWRRYARVARRLSLGTEAVAQLAETAFTHIDEIAAESVAAYARAQADAAGTLGRRRHRLLTLLIASEPPSPESLEQAARDAEWALPESVVGVALGPRWVAGAGPGSPTRGGTRPPAPGSDAGPDGPPTRDLDAPPTPGPRPGTDTGPGEPLTHDPCRSPASARDADPAPTLRKPLPRDVLAELDGPTPCLLVPDPGTRLADPRLHRLLHERSGVIGPVVPLAQAADSLRWARTLREHGPAGARRDAGRHLTDLLLLADPALVRLMAARRLAPLTGLTPKQRNRLAHTLLAHLQTPHGSAPELAERLDIHPQTARQRLHHLQRLFGPALTDTDARFELEAALRAEGPDTQP